jgi:hypothetical protein
MVMTTKDAADALAGVAAGKRNAAVVPPGGADADYRRKTALGGSGKPFAENTQDPTSASNASAFGNAPRTERSR